MGAGSLFRKGDEAPNSTQELPNVRDASEGNNRFEGIPYPRTRSYFECTELHAKGSSKKGTAII
jgi:hypothetical protein